MSDSLRSAEGERAAPVVLVVALSLSIVSSTGSCSHVVWRGHDPDRRRRVEIIERSGRQWVRVDGKPGRRYRGIGIDAMVFGPRGKRLAYAAQRDCGWAVVVDGRPGGCWEGVASVRFGPRGRRLVYVAQRGRRWQVVADGVAGPAFDAVFPGSIIFDRRGRRLGYVARRGHRMVAIIDGRLIAAHDGIGQLRFSAAGQVAYVARDGREARVVVDGFAGPGFDEIRGLLLLGSDRLHYLARRGSCWQLASSQQRSAALSCHGYAAGLTTDPSGIHIAYVAGEDGQQRVVADGNAGPWVDAVSTSTLRVLRDGRPLYIARARAGAYLAVVGTQQRGPFSAVEVAVSVDGRRWGYIGQRSGQAEVVVDGHLIGRHPRAGGLVIADRGAAYISRVRRGRSVWIHHRVRRSSKQPSHETRYRYDLAVSGTLVMDDLGGHWACLVGRRADRTLHIAVDGHLQKRVRSGEIVAAATIPDPPLARRLRRWVAAELRRPR